MLNRKMHQFMKEIRKLTSGCDYSPAFCDGDVGVCESASLHGANSEIGRRNGAFEKKEFERELEPFFGR